MKAHTRSSRLLVIVALLIHCWLVIGWGDDGHKTIAEIAERHLTNTSAAWVQRILGGKSMAFYSVYADSYSKTPYGNWSMSCHFLDWPKGWATDDWRSHCGSCCVIGAVLNYTDILNNRQKYSKVEVSDALKFLIHFAGDIHQPLHAGFKEDRGGNLVNVTWMGTENTSLHLVWDVYLLKHWMDVNLPSTVDRQDGYLYLSSQLEANASPTDIYKWLEQMAPFDWAVESHELDYHTVYDFTGSELGQDYYAQQIVYTLQRLAMAGFRLANLLNSIFDDPASR